jgi:hypothetical protein
LAVLSKDYELIAADMEGLSLSDEQKDKLKELKLASVQKAEAPSDDLSPGEVKMNAQLEFRKNVRELLNDEQKEKWEKQFAEKAKSPQNLRNTSGGKVMRRAQ